MKGAWLMALIALGIGVSSGSAQQPWSCAEPAFRGFDFWIGTWEMRDRRSGTPLGTASVRPVHGGCAIREDWQARSGGSGANIVTYHPPINGWRMVSVTSNGGFLVSQGTLTNSRLSFLTDTHIPNGKPQRRRITWATTDDPNRVLQTWEVTEDDGKSWFTEFDGLCIRTP
jgi:hypothetical protein